MKSSLPFLITLEPCSPAQIDKATQQLAQLDFLVEPCLHLPVLE
jgi:hypothetical protein